MAETVFACPACQQKISGDDAWAGQQIQCPICQQAITMPGPAGAGGSKAAGSPLVPKPPGQPRLSLNQNAQQPAPTHQKHIPIRNLADAPRKKQGPWRMIAEITAIVLVLGVGAWFAWPYVKAKLDREPKEEQVAAVEPVQEAPPAEMSAEPGMPMPNAEGYPGDPNAAPPVIVNVEQTGPVIPPTHNLTLAASRTPSGRVNGKITGADFVPEIVRIDSVGASQVLRFVQGEPTSPDRELLVYLRFKQGEKLVGQKIEVTSETRTGGLPQVIKRWKTNPRYAPSSRSYSSGYAMRIEFNSHEKGVVKGRIYVALPDNEKSVVGGNFAASTTIPAEGIAMPTVAAPGQSPMGGEGTMVPNPEFHNRYTR
jgi:hypothetical protein